MERNEELTDDRVHSELREIRRATATICLLLLVIALLLAAVVFGFAEVTVSPA